MNVMITGASGFLAWEIIRQMKLNGSYCITAATSSPKKYYETDSNYNGVKLVSNDELFLEMEKIQIIIHTAFCRKSIGSDLMNSLQFTRDLCECAVDNNVKGIINISSQSVYGADKAYLPDENGKYAPEYMYALAKAESELLIETIAKKRKEMCYTNIRLAGLVGKSKNVPINVLYKFVENAINGKNICIQGGRQKFSFIDVKDAAEAIIRLLYLQCDKWDTVYNLGPEKQTNIMDLAESAVKYASRIGLPTVDILVNEDDTQLNAGMKSDKIYKLLNWKPKYSIEKTIQTTGEYILACNNIND